MVNLTQSPSYKCVQWRLNVPGLKDPRPKKYRHGALPDPNAPLAKLVSWNYGDKDLCGEFVWYTTPHRSIRKALKDLESVTGAEAQYCLDSGDLYTVHGTTAPIEVQEVERQMRELRGKFSRHNVNLSKPTLKPLHDNFEPIVLGNDNIHVFEHEPTTEQKALIEQLKEAVEIELLPNSQELCAEVDELLDYCQREGLVEDREFVEGRLSTGLIYPLSIEACLRKADSILQS